jgi:hypothetical protein
LSETILVGFFICGNIKLRMIAYVVVVVFRFITKKPSKTKSPAPPLIVRIAWEPC